jgi:hypothetical protein
MTSVDRIQGLSGSLAIKTPCRLATTAAITLSGEQTIDGVAAVADDRVLVKDQATSSTNGIYDVSTGSWTRSLDFDGPNDIKDGTLVLVGSGSTNADMVFKLNATEPITIGTTALTFTGAATFTNISAFAATVLDDATAADARTTLGLAIGTNVQAYDAELAALAGLTSAANKVPMFSGSGTATMLDFKDEDNMASDSATAVPSQQSVKAYVDASGAAAASQAEQEAATSNTVMVTPANQQYHPSAPKAWARFAGATAGTNAPSKGYNVTSITRTGTGAYTVNLAITMSDSVYAVVVSANGTSNAGNNYYNNIAMNTQGATSFTLSYAAGALADPSIVCFAVYGDI